MSVVNNAKDVLGLVAVLITVCGTIVGVLLQVRQIREGQKCLLRSEILRIYYKCESKKEIRQFEFENLTYLRAAYKALRGNSFVDKIWAEAQEWHVIS